MSDHVLKKIIDHNDEVYNIYDANAIHTGDVVSTYSASGTNPVNGTAIAAALDTLDVSSVGGAGKYISAISETNGKISATATSMDTTPTANSTNAVTSGGIKTELDKKQATLDTQTAYTEIGSATTVPQITTNSLGQVTGITEVTISGVTPASHTHGNISNTGTLTDTAAAASGDDYVVIRDASDNKVQTSTIKGTDVADAVSKKHSHSILTLSTTAQKYDGTHTLALPANDPYTSARTPASHTHGNIANDGTLTDTAAAAAGNDYIVIRDESNNKIQTSTIKGTAVADAVSKKHSHTDITLSTTATAYDGTHTIALPASDPYTSARTPSSHTHGNISNSGTLTDTAAAAAGNDYVVIRDADNAKVQTSTIKGTDVADAVSKKHSHSNITLSTTATAYDGTHTIALPTSDPYTSARTPASHTHGNISNDGKIGSTANLPVITGTSGAVTTGSFSTSATAVATSSAAGTANTFSRGDHKHSISLATGDNPGQVKIAGSNVSVNGWSGKADVATTLGGYGITDAYTKSETDSLLNGQVQVVATLPASGTTGVVYYVGPSGSGADKYEEYIWDATNSQFIKVGERSVDLSNITSGSSLATLFGQIKKWYSSFGSLAWKSTVANGDISGTIADSHIASASTWNAKQDALDTQNAYTSQGSATKVPQITTNSLGQVTGITEVTISGVTPASHTHGNIQNSGTLQTNDVTIATGDKLVITDSSNSNKVARASVSFDGSTTTTALTPKGTFETFSKLELGNTSSTAAAGDHSHGYIGNGGTLTDTAAAAAGNDYVVIRDADNAKIQTSTIKGTDVADAVSKKHSHSNITLSTTATAYDGSHTIALPSTDPYTSARTPSSHTHGNITNGGALQTNDITIASGDKLVVTDASDSNKVARTSVAFDGSTVSKALTQKGTFESVMLAADAMSFATGNGLEIATSGTTATLSMNISAIPTATITSLIAELG